MAISASSMGQSRTRRASTIFVGLAVLVVVAALAGLLIYRAVRPGALPDRNFHDTLGLFSANVPAGWKATGGIPTNEKLVVHGTSMTLEVYGFEDQQKGNASAGMALTVIDLNNATARAAYCQPVSGFQKTTVDGLPAAWVLPNLLRFHSGNASFQFQTFIPTAPQYGDDLGHTLLPIPTVTNPAAVQAQVQSIINSIQVTDPGPCK